MGLFTKKHYLFVVRRKSGELLCDLQEAWVLFQELWAKDGIHTVHPKDWDDEPYVGAYYTQCIKMLYCGHEAPFLVKERVEHIIDDQNYCNEIRQDFENNRRGKYTPDELWQMYNAITTYIGVGPDAFSKMTLGAQNKMEEEEGFIFIHVIK